MSYPRIMAPRPATRARRRVERGSGLTPTSHAIARPETTSIRSNQNGEKGGSPDLENERAVPFSVARLAESY